MTCLCFLDQRETASSKTLTRINNLDQAVGTGVSRGRVRGRGRGRG